MREHGRTSLEKLLTAFDAKGSSASWFASLALALNAAEEAPASVRLEWDPSPDPGIHSYRLYLGTESGAYSRAFGAGQLTSVQVRDLTAGQVYFFAVTAATADGLESEFSNEVEFAPPSTTPSTAPDTVIQLHAGIGVLL